MVKVNINGIQRVYDGYLVKNLDINIKAVNLKWDGVFYVGGYEGDGKSEFSAQMALYFDPSYCLDRCVFTPQQFLDAVDKAEPKQAIVYDEAQDAFESTNRDVMSRAIKSKMTRIRKKQLYIIIVAPDFWRINKYMFIHRSRAFIRVYADGLSRGYFEYYNRTKKHELMIRGKKNEQLCVPPNFRAKFSHWFPLNEEDYDAKKEAATQEVGRDQEAKEDKFKLVQQRILLADFLKASEKGELLNVSTRQIFRLAKNTKENRACDGVTFTKQLPNGVVVK